MEGQGLGTNNTGTGNVEDKKPKVKQEPKPKVKPNNNIATSIPKTEDKLTTSDMCKAKAKEAFTIHEFNTVYVTTDGQCFAEYSNAMNHGRTLADKFVANFNRADFE